MFLAAAWAIAWSSFLSIVPLFGFNDRQLYRIQDSLHIHKRLQGFLCIIPGIGGLLGIVQHLLGFWL